MQVQAAHAESNNAAGVHCYFADAFAVYKQAVAAVQVFDPPLTILHVALRVDPAHVLVLQADFTFLGPANAKRPSQAELLQRTGLCYLQGEKRDHTDLSAFLRQTEQHLARAPV